MSYYIGIDLGGTFVKCGIVDEQGKILIKDKIPTGNGRPYTEIAADMAEFAKQLISRAGLKKEDVKAAGIGAPGTVDSKNGVIVYSNNIRWENVPLCREIEKRLGLPTYITNDANAAALGENFCGAGKDYQSMVFITLGTGVGGGIIIDGKIFEGNKSAGAEIGHEVIRMGGEKCTCGRRGCFEAYASATALLLQRFHELPELLSGSRETLAPQQNALNHPDFLNGELPKARQVGPLPHFNGVCHGNQHPAVKGGDKIVGRELF